MGNDIIPEVILNWTNEFQGKLAERTLVHETKCDPQNSLGSFKITSGITIVMVSYYTGPILWQAIESSLSQEGLQQLIIVDNGNPSDFIERLNKIAAENNKVRLVTGHGNIGFGKACNLGAGLANSEYFLFLNPDCIIENKKTVQLMISALKMSEDYFAASCTILNMDGSIQKTCRRNLLSPLIGISESFNLYKLSDCFKPLNLNVEEIKNLPPVSEVPAISGAVICISKEKFQQINGFDERYFIHNEDMDLCMTIKIQGGKIIFVKDAIIKHALSTSETTSQFLEYHKARGFIMYTEKYFYKYNNVLIKYLFRSLIWLRYFIKVYIFKVKNH